MNNSPPSRSFRSSGPQVRLVNAFREPFRNVIDTARTCYSSTGPVDSAGMDPARYADLARGIYAAGHHTTFQHAQVQFLITGVSRQAIWSFLHAHPFYNSEQVSQRYVEVRPDQFAVPPIADRNLGLYQDRITSMTRAYHDLIEALTEPATEAYFSVFPARRRQSDAYRSAIRKRAMEAARYVLPLSVTAYLYHTVSILTVLRYYRLCRLFDAPLEQELLAQAMVDAVLDLDPNYRVILEEPLEPDQMPEYAFLHHMRNRSHGDLQVFQREFDASLQGRTSVLTDWSTNAESTLATSVRDVFGLSSGSLSDDEAISLVLDPAKNTGFSEALVLTTHGKLSRALHTVHYTFRRKLSHSADSQDQRHRMTPSARPILAAQVGDEPDFIMPDLIARTPEAEDIFLRTMDEAWKGYRQLRDGGESEEFAAYLLPNAVSVRYSQGTDLLHLHHKHAMRLCYNAQEEIWASAVDEALQIRDKHPRIGSWLLPPCSLRHHAGKTPYCPEGDRYCGVKVWTMDPKDYRRLL